MRTLSSKQVQANDLARDHRLNIWEGAVRSGKTLGSLYAWSSFVAHAPVGPLLMVGKTERTLQRNIIDPMLAIFGRHCTFNAGKGEVELVGRRIYVVGANDERSAEKIRGMTLAGFYADEVSVLPASFWDMLLSRISVEGARGFGTTNPDSPTHWLKTKYLDKASVHLDGSGVVIRSSDPEAHNLARFSFKLSDNESLPEEYLSSIKKQYTGLWKKRFIDGLWVIAEGAIYEDYDPERHVLRGPLPAMVRTPAVGIDHGTTNPFSAIAIGLTPAGKLIAYSEWRWDPTRERRKLTDGEFSTRVRAWMATLPHRPNYVAVDPAAESFRVQLFEDRVSGTQNAKNTVLPGIRLVASLLASGQLLIHESCTGLLNELPSYSWDDDAAAKGEDKPIKLNDHSCDALRYALLTSYPNWKRDVKGQR